MTEAIGKAREDDATAPEPRRADHPDFSRPDTTTSWQEVSRYEWDAIAPPDLSSWRPSRAVSVVIPAFNCQEQLDRTLAALAHQRYPAALLEVVVADDGSAVPLTVPEIAPENTRVLRLDRDKEWGRARACHAGATVAEGEILLFLDADMVAFPDHVSAHARWHHVIREAVTLGHKLFVDFDGITTQDVAQAAARDTLFDLLAHRPYLEHEWVEGVIARTRLLTAYEPSLFTAAVGATVAMRADLYWEVGGFRTHLKAGEDMEMGYRLMTGGAVFIPERLARSWHQGPATFMTKAAEVRRRNEPHFSNYVPVPGGFRPWTPGRQYAVPRVDVIVRSSGNSFEAGKACVEAVLAGEDLDVHVELSCPPTGSDAELLEAEYAHDPRVHVRPDLPASGFPSTFTMFIPESAALSPHSLGDLVDLMEASGVGLLRITIPGISRCEDEVSLWRTAALHRARRAANGASLADVVDGLFGQLEVDGAEVGLVGLDAASLSDLPKKRPSTAEVYRRLRATRQELRAVKQELRRLRRRHRRLAKRHRVADAAQPSNGRHRPPRRRGALWLFRRVQPVWPRGRRSQS